MLLRVLSSLVALALPAWACSVPVFRYALEHWDADPYQAVVFHRGALTPEQEELVKKLGNTGANLAVRTVDITATPEAGAENQELPSVAISYPRRADVLWRGPLSDAARVVTSPVRKEVAERLCDGESAVWVFLESGDAEQDNAAVAELEKRLAYLSTTLELPKLDAEDIANGLVSVGQEDLRLEFSVLRLSRTAPEEQVFVKMLLNTEEDLAELNEPMVFPIFGRGRALYALVGKGIKAETIDRAAIFLIGKCSCEVKEGNPGADLLMTADWKAAAKGDGHLKDLPSAAELAESAPQTVTIEAEPATVATAVETPKQTGWIFGAAAGVMALLGVVALFFGKNSARGKE